MLSWSKLNFALTRTSVKDPSLHIALSRGARLDGRVLGIHPVRAHYLRRAELAKCGCGDSDPPPHSRLLAFSPPPSDAAPCGSELVAGKARKPCRFPAQYRFPPGLRPTLSTPHQVLR